MTISANNCGAWKGKALLGPYDVYNPLTLVSETEIGDTKLFHVVFESKTLYSRISLFDEGADALEVLSRSGGYILNTVSCR